MPVLPRRSAISTASLLGVAVLLGSVVACGPAAPTTTGPTSLAPGPSGSPVPEAPSASDTTSQTETEWGRIWDAVPDGFPRFPGATTATDIGPDPVSDAYLVAEGDPQTVVDWLQSALELATFSTEALSGPLEDGSFVLDSMGTGACRIQTTIAPLDAMILVTTLYGADCAR